MSNSFQQDENKKKLAPKKLRGTSFEVEENFSYIWLIFKSF